MRCQGLRALCNSSATHCPPPKTTPFCAQWHTCSAGALRVSLLSSLYTPACAARLPIGEAPPPMHLCRQASISNKRNHCTGSMFKVGGVQKPGQQEQRAPVQEQCGAQAPHQAISDRRCRRVPPRCAPASLRFGPRHSGCQQCYEHPRTTGSRATVSQGTKASSDHHKLNSSARSTPSHREAGMGQ